MSYQDITIKPESPAEVSIEPDGTFEIHFPDVGLTLLLTPAVAIASSKAFWDARAKIRVPRDDIFHDSLTKLTG